MFETPFRIQTATRHARVVRLAAFAALACAAAAARADIYTCIDAQGHYLTADRPILACNDREQRVLDSSGVPRTLSPQMTAAERAQQDARKRQAEFDRQRANDAARRDQVLLIRYPDKKAHDQVRAAELAMSQAVIDAANAQLDELAEERQTLAKEMEFYKNDPSLAPPGLRRRIEDNAQSMEIQRQTIANQENERARINQRFDKELITLRQLWSAADRPLAGTPNGN